MGKRKKKYGREAECWNSANGTKTAPETQPGLSGGWVEGWLKRGRSSRGYRRLVLISR